jgi:pimeloyl-ACP methyl ester carboxylesterase
MRSLKKLGLGLLSGIILILSMLYFLQEKLIFLPTKLDQDYRYNFEEPFEEFTVERPDGASLNALRFRRDKPYGVILYFHGNAGDLSRWGEVVQDLVRHNYDLVIMDYRTYGKSRGRLSEEALLADAQAFYDYTTEIYNKEDIIVYGRSLGTAMASYLSSRNPVPLLVLETPFYSMLDVARDRFPIIPVELFLKYPFKNHEFLEETESRIVILHGDKDKVVPIESAKKLYRSLDGKPAEFIEIEGGKHNDLGMHKKYQNAIRELLMPVSK